MKFGIQVKVIILFSFIIASIDSRKSKRTHTKAITPSTIFTSQNLDILNLVQGLSYSKYNNMQMLHHPDGEFIFKKDSSKHVDVGTYAFVYGISNVDKELFIVSFRGSINFCNFKTDFEAEPVADQCENCMVHSGFSKAFNEIKQKVDEEVDPLLKKYANDGTIKRVIITGHSLGAVLSVLYTNHVMKKYKIAGAPLIEVGNKLDFYNINFGLPRIGDVNFKNHMNSYVTNGQLKRLLRITFGQDIFTFIPSGFGDNHQYLHPGTEIHFEYKNIIFGNEIIFEVSQNF